MHQWTSTTGRASGLRLLHIGSGFRPWRRGGLVAYTEDLMDEQVRSGDQVAYFFSGRQYPLARGPRLRRWERSGVKMLEVVNSSLYDHGRQPELELSEPWIERTLELLLEELQPQAVHVHELAGLPSSILSVVQRSGTPVLLTLQDYFPLCPAFKLLDAHGQVCLRREVGEDCVATLATDPREPGLLIDATVVFHLMRWRLVQRLPVDRRRAMVLGAGKLIGRLEAARRRRRKGALGPGPQTLQRRREVNVERLSQADALVAMSTRVAEIYTQLGVDSARLRTLQLTLSHIERLRPRRAGRESRLTFATLAGFESVPKGALVLLEAVRRLQDHAEAGRFRLLVFGFVAPELAAQARGLAGIDIRGGYEPEQLQAMLDQVDVGIMPSIWEEAYGYAGIEFLAKGIPVIANAIGGMTDYTRDRETGWLNRSCSGEELARIMSDVIERPHQVAELNSRLRSDRDSIIVPLARHTSDMDAIYRELIT